MLSLVTRTTAYHLCRGSFSCPSRPSPHTPMFSRMESTIFRYASLRRRFILFRWQALLDVFFDTTKPTIGKTCLNEDWRGRTYKVKIGVFTDFLALYALVKRPGRFSLSVNGSISNQIDTR